MSSRRSERIGWLFTNLVIGILAIIEKGYEFVFFGIWSDVVVVHFSCFRIFEKLDTQGEKQVFTSSSLIPHLDISVAQFESVCRERDIDASAHCIINSFLCEGEVSNTRNIGISAFEGRNEKYDRKYGRKKYRSKQENFLVWKRILGWYWFRTSNESFHWPFQRTIFFCSLQASESYFSYFLEDHISKITLLSTKTASLCQKIAKQKTSFHEKK